MKMIVAAAVGAVVLGFVHAQFLADEVAKLVTDAGLQKMAGAGVAAFLGSLWGWSAKGVMGRNKD